MVPRSYFKTITTNIIQETNTFVYFENRESILLSRTFASTLTPVVKFRVLCNGVFFKIIQCLAIIMCE